MLKSYIKTAWRNFLKYRFNSLVNLSGVSIALAFVFLIFIYVQYHLSFDKWYSNSSRIYRIVSVNNDGSESVMLPSALASTLAQEFPSIESYTSLNKSDFDFFVNGKPFSFSCVNGDTSFFHVFNFKFLYGNPNSVFNTTNGIVITEELANTLFKKTNAIGESIQYKDYNGNVFRYEIRGVIKNVPDNTHFNAQAFLGKPPFTQKLDWKMYSSVTQYVLLNKHADIKELQKNIESIYKKYNFPEYLHLRFQAVTKIHLHSNIKDEPFANSDISYIYIFSFAAMLLMLIACINYINLTTASSLQRIKEVGVRKVMGARSAQLSFQFITESLVFFLCIMPVVVLLIKLLWPFFSSTVKIPFEQDYFFNVKFILFFLLFCIATGIIAGCYPAFFVSRLRPAYILKDMQKSYSFNMIIRKSLVVFQFIISLSLIIATIVISDQLQLLNNMPLGFDKNYLLELPYIGYLNDSSINKRPAFTAELNQYSAIRGVTISTWDAGERYGASSKMDSQVDSSKSWDFSFIDADMSFIKTAGIKIVEGRDFSINDAASPGSIIITDETVKILELKEPIIGKVLNYPVLQGTVIGVTKNFLGTSLLQETPNVVLRCHPDQDRGHVYVKISSANISNTLKYIESVWKKYFPSQVYTFSFVDEKLQHLYDAQKQMASVFNSFAPLAIIVSLFGLISLVSLTVQQKTKEIGIRKVFGADIKEIVFLISVEFLKLITLAIVVALPLSWFIMNKWLQNFSYRVNITPSLLMIVGTLCLLLCFITISFQSIKAAIANPVKSLRTE